MNENGIHQDRNGFWRNADGTFTKRPLGAGCDPNIPLLRKAVEWAEVEAAQERGRWDQSAWVDISDELYEKLSVEQNANIFGVRATAQDLMDCGTTFCIAGMVMLGSLQTSETCDYWGDIYDANGDRIETARERAQRELGLTSSAANALFAAGNSIGVVRTIAEEIAGERL